MAGGLTGSLLIAQEIASNFPQRSSKQDVENARSTRNKWRCKQSGKTQGLPSPWATPYNRHIIATYMFLFSGDICFVPVSLVKEVKMKCMVILCNVDVSFSRSRNVVNMHASALSVKEIEDYLDQKAEP